MRIEIYKTFEIPDDLWPEITEGFNESFDLHSTVTEFRKSFSVRNKLGYGFHAVAFADNGEVAGFHTQSPTFYKGGLNVIVAGSSYVRKKYRQDIFIFYEMSRRLAEYCHGEGFSVKVGVPNHNSYDYSIKILKSIYVGNLDYYILPFRLSTCLHKPSLKIFDWLVFLMARLHVCFQLFLSTCFNHREKVVKYELETTPEYFVHRFPSPYKKYDNGDIVAYYRMYDEDGAKTAYLFDCRENGVRTSKAVAAAAAYIAGKERPDAILFVGWLRLIQHTLFKVPERFVPKKLPLTYYVLDKGDKQKYDDMRNRDNWNFSLMNFDVR